MNVRLIAMLVLFGIAMGIATLLGVTHGMELPLWLVIAVVFAIGIARAQGSRHFLHGLVAGALAGIVSPLIQLAFFDTYLRNNPFAAQSFKGLPAGVSPRLFVMIVAPFLVICYGLFVGLATWITAKAMRKKTPAPSST